MKRPVAAVLNKKGHLYILDKGLSSIYKVSMEGEFLLTIGRQGQGPGELFRPNDLALIGNKLWVADSRNGRIQVFEDDRFLESIKLRGIRSPSNLAVVGDEVFISGASLTPHHGPITVLSDKGEVLRELSWFPDDHTYKGNTVGLWTSLRMRPMRDRLLLGFTFDNLITVLDDTGTTVANRRMDGLYEAYSVKRGSDLMPAGFSAMAFGEGPDQTVLVATCDLDNRRCGTLIRLSPGLDEVIQRWDFGSSIRYIACLTDYEMLILINLDAEVRIYGYQ